MIILDKEFQALIPPLSAEEKAQLEENIVAEGCRDALITWQGILLDGHNRFEICERLNIPFRTMEIDLPDRDAAKLWIIKNQFGRRNLCAFDRGSLALKMKDIIASKAKENQGTRTDILTTLSKSEPINTRAEIAKMAGISEGTIAKVDTIQREATPDQIYRLKSGEASVNQVYNEIKHPHVSHNSGENEWYTPPEYIEAARIVLGGHIDLDPASSVIANRLVKAETFYTKETDGLNKHWSGNVWMNPPYASDLIRQFTSKFSHHVIEGNIKTGIVLVNNATETAWFRELINCANAVLFTTGRIKYLDAQGNPKNTPLQGQAFIYFGEKPLAFLFEFKKFGWGFPL